MKRRTGYSILELMIALALLGVLLATSWSLLETYRKAEQRSWDLVDRTRSVRVSTQWLENDLLHLYVDMMDNAATTTGTTSAATSKPQSTTATRDGNLIPSANANAKSNNKPTGLKARFSGNSQGFQAVIVPSVDPAPWMERLFESSEESQLELSKLPSALSSDSNQNDEEAIRRPVVLNSIEISYELSLTGESTQTSQQPISVFDLVRTERISRDQLPQEPEDSWKTVEEPILDAQDLYRQSDEWTDEEGFTIRENSIQGLADAAFWYFDGKAWAQNWNKTDGSPPVAIALVFDFAPRQGVQPVERLEFTDSSSSNGAILNSPRGDNSIDQSAPLLESSANSFEMLRKDNKLVFQTPVQMVAKNNKRGSQQLPQVSQGPKP